MRQASLRDCIIETPSRIDQVPSNLKTANLDVELLGVLHFHGRLADALDDLGDGKYDYVILDCPPNLSMNTLNAFGASNVVVIPVQLKREAFDAVTHLMNTLLNLHRIHQRKRITVLAIAERYDSLDKRQSEAFHVLRKVCVGFRREVCPAKVQQSGLDVEASISRRYAEDRRLRGLPFSVKPEGSFDRIDTLFYVE